MWPSKYGAPLVFPNRPWSMNYKINFRPLVSIYLIIASLGDIPCFFSFFNNPAKVLLEAHNLASYMPTHSFDVDQSTVDVLTIKKLGSA